jgi:hypothetical protein
MSKQNNKMWNRALSEHATTLQQQANIASLMAMAETPLDGLAVAWDIVMAAAHTARLREARASGRAAPAAPAPVSRLLSGFASTLRNTLATVGAQLDHEERARLAAVAPGVVASIEAQDTAVIETLAQLMTLPPESITEWVRDHLDQIEARFAS